MELMLNLLAKAPKTSYPTLSFAGTVSDNGGPEFHDGLWEPVWLGLNNASCSSTAHICFDQCSQR